MMRKPMSWTRVVSAGLVRAGSITYQRSWTSSTQSSTATDEKTCSNGTTFDLAVSRRISRILLLPAHTDSDKLHMPALKVALERILPALLHIVFVDRRRDSTVLVAIVRRRFARVVFGRRGHDVAWGGRGAPSFAVGSRRGPKVGF